MTIQPTFFPDLNPITRCPSGTLFVLFARKIRWSCTGNDLARCFECGKLVKWVPQTLAILSLAPRQTRSLKS